VSELCACSKKFVDRECATWVFRGQPCCNQTCMRAAEARYQARQRAMAARDVPIGTSWAFTDHRTLAEADRPTRIVPLGDGSHVVVG